MRHSSVWLLGGFALLGFLRRRRGSPTPPADELDPRADELRRKLAESRAIVDEREEFEAAEPTVDRTEHAPEAPERRRQAVHEAGQSLAERMRKRGS